jgi:hypothetical protein
MYPSTEQFSIEDEYKEVYSPPLDIVLKMSEFDVLNVRSIDGLEEESIEPGDW